ncbi:BTB/POZ domain-containing protein 6-like [Haliotis rubra]|uniref:BTB/POZ domain-containing protein 6-like n=1 Tax=Haliotis rubra TaxID=36100 RepID=UPI001EE52B6C|nr:BTB/POZ domain-containing protein 6-like [Haliotis rubra]
MDIREWMAVNYLKLNDSKTEFLAIGSRQQLQKMPPGITLKIGTEDVKTSNSARNLGIIFQSNMSLDEYVKSLCKSCFFHIYNIGKIRNFLDTETTKLLMQTLTMLKNKESSGFVDDWQSGKTVTECNLRMLDTEDFSDVTFRVGSEQQAVQAHRYVLVSRSCVFHAMFCGKLAEKEEVSIPDIEPNIFKEFLRFVYTDKADVSAGTVTGLMYTSRKYSVDALFYECVMFLETCLSESNVCQILEDCHRYGELDLEQKALMILTKGGEGVVRSPGFAQLCSSCLEKFLKSENLKSKEEDIFEAIVSWTKHRCLQEGVSDTPENRRRLLGDLRYEIRFSSMPLDYLLTVVGPSEVLTDRERFRVIDRRVNSHVDISPFKDIQRRESNHCTEEPVSYRYVYRCRDYGLTALHSGTHAISFSANQDIHLKGCQLYGACFDETYTLTIKVFDSSHLKIAEPLQQVKTVLEGENQPNDIPFPSSLLLISGATYTLCVDMDGPDTYIGWEGRDKVIADGIEFTFNTSSMATSGTTEKMLKCNKLVKGHSQILPARKIELGTVVWKQQ